MVSVGVRGGVEGVVVERWWRGGGEEEEETERAVLAKLSDWRS
jgi:hypothetical protein